MNPFYMVYSDSNFAKAPTFKHPTEGDARKEAERLAGLNPGTGFFVLKTIGIAKKVDVKYQDIGEYEDEIPF